MKEIRFKQPRVNHKGEFIDWFYWGFIDGGFIAPLRHDLPSYQYVGFRDCSGTEIYDGARVLYAGYAGTVVYDQVSCNFRVKADGKQRVQYQALSRTRQAQIYVRGHIYTEKELGR